MNRHRKVEILLVTVLFALAVFFCFYKLSYPDIQKWDESTNADVVYETLRSDSPLVLQFQGKPFFEKPPLFYYAEMGVVGIFGFNEFSLRLVSAVCGLGLMILVYFMGKSFYSHMAGFFASLSLLAIGQLFFSYPANVFSTHHIRSADSDMMQLFFMTAAFYLFYFYSKKKKIVWLCLGVVCSGLAVMTKGILGILPLMIFLYYLLFISRPIKIKLKPIGITLLLLFIIIFPWHYCMYQKFGDEFINSYFFYHMLSRVSTALEHHAEPWWFYVKVLSTKDVYFGLELLFVGIVVMLQDAVQRIRYDGFSVIAIVFLLLLQVSAMGTKLAWYIIGIYPFAALILGYLIVRLQTFNWLRLRPRIARVIIGALLIYTGYFVGKNLIGIARLNKGETQQFFESALVLCPRGIGYEGMTPDRDTQYVLLRYGIGNEYYIPEKMTESECRVERKTENSSNYLADTILETSAWRLVKK